MFTNKDVMALRAKTGVGMMDCKNALTESDGNMDRAVEILREKGIATANKRADKIASQGVVSSYIHMGGKIGVLVEVNCESDFVARGEQFNNFVHDVALQIAAANPKYITKDEVPQEEIDKEKSILTAQALGEDKPKPRNIIDKMVEGRIVKYFKDVCLLEQPFVKDSARTVSDLLNESVAKIGEKISIRRFTRYEMGEGLEKKNENLADEVQAQIDSMKK